MLFLPFDAFGAYQKGQQSGIDDNWKDIFNYEKAAKETRENREADVTSDGRVGMALATQQYAMDTLPGRAVATNAQSLNLAQTLPNKTLADNVKYASTVATQPFLDAATIAQQKNVAALAPTALLAGIGANNMTVRGQALDQAAYPGRLALAQAGSAVDTVTGQQTLTNAPDIGNATAETRRLAAMNAFADQQSVVPAQQGATVATSNTTRTAQELIGSDLEFVRAQPEILQLMSVQSPENAAALSRALQTTFPGAVVGLVAGQYVMQTEGNAPVPLAQALASRQVATQSRIAATQKSLPTPKKGDDKGPGTPQMQSVLGTAPAAATTAPGALPQKVGGIPVPGAAPAAQPAPAVPVSPLRQSTYAPVMPFQNFVAQNWTTPVGQITVREQAAKNRPEAMTKLQELLQAFTAQPQGSAARTVLQKQIELVGEDVAAMDRVLAPAPAPAGAQQ